MRTLTASSTNIQDDTFRSVTSPRWDSRLVFYLFKFVSLVPGHHCLRSDSFAFRFDFIADEFKFDFGLMSRTLLWLQQQHECKKTTRIWKATCIEPYRSTFTRNVNEAARCGKKFAFYEEKMESCKKFKSNKLEYPSKEELRSGIFLLMSHKNKPIFDLPNPMTGHRDPDK